MTARNLQNRRKYSSEIVAVNENLASLLGARVMQQLGLIKVHDETFEKVAAVKVTSDIAHTAKEIIEEYKDV